MKKLKFVRSILVLTSLAVVIGCSQNESVTNTPANSGQANVNAGTNSVPQNTAANNSSPSNTAAGVNEYPQSVVNEFVTACEQTGAKREDCECVFEKVRQQYTFEQFSEIEAKLNAEEPADDFVQFSEKAREECMKQAG